MSRDTAVERVTEIEPAWPAWKAWSPGVSIGWSERFLPLVVPLSTGVSRQPRSFLVQIGSLTLKRYGRICSAPMDLTESGQADASSLAADGWAAGEGRETRSVSCAGVTAQGHPDDAALNRALQATT